MYMYDGEVVAAQLINNALYQRSSISGNQSLSCDRRARSLMLPVNRSAIWGLRTRVYAARETQLSLRTPWRCIGFSPSLHDCRTNRIRKPCNKRTTYQMFKITQGHGRLRYSTGDMWLPISDLCTATGHGVNLARIYGEMQTPIQKARKNGNFFSLKHRFLVNSGPYF